MTSRGGAKREESPNFLNFRPNRRRFCTPSADLSPLHKQSYLRDMITVDERIDPRWLLPVCAEGEPLTDHSVMVDSGRILDVLPTSRAQSTYAPRTTTRLDRHIVLPGLVNAHTHAAMTLLRGFADDLPLMVWLNEYIWPAETKWVNESFVTTGTELAAIEMIRSGTTCFNDMYFWPDAVGRRCQEIGIRASVGLIVLEFPTPWAETPDDYLNKGLQIHDELRHFELITTAFAPHAPYTVSDAMLRRVRVLADELDIQVHIHVHETDHEIEESLQRYGLRPLERLAQLGLVGRRLQAVHMTHLLNDEIRSLGDAGVNVVHCPHSNLKLASGFCPVGALIENGINVSLGTDGAASNNSLDLIAEARSAALLAKGFSGTPTTVPAATALHMATMGGATALGLEDEIGSIERGKSADLIAIDLDHPATTPVYDPVAAVVYSAGREQVTDAWVAGRRLMENRTLLTIDTNRVSHDARNWSERIA